MDIFDWIQKHIGKSIAIAIFFVAIVPFLIDKICSMPAPCNFFAESYTSKDVLSFYGIILGSITTIIALMETVQHAEKMHTIDYERKLTPLLDSNYYSNSPDSRTPLRVLFVNMQPMHYLCLDHINVLSSLDPRDLNDTLHHAQIDYLVQNISETSAVNINLFLNGHLLHGPFSLVAGSEESIGICFFDENGRMIDEYPKKSKFHIEIKYTNADHSRKYVQSEDICVSNNFISLTESPAYIPDYESRAGLSNQSIE